jgi:ATP-dependent helicase YprA (DUF1998 family)
MATKKPLTALTSLPKKEAVPTPAAADKPAEKSKPAAAATPAEKDDKKDNTKKAAAAAEPADKSKKPAAAEEEETDKDGKKKAAKAEKSDKDGEETGEGKEEEEAEGNWDKVVASFDDMGLKDDLLRGIYAYGFEKPSAIQQRGIMPILAGHDTIAQAQSGTGKTATFAISCLQLLDLNINKTQALILAPTRELAQQIQKVTRALGDYLKVTSHACVGGTLVRDDIRILKDGVQVVVGTPGRVYDMINRNVLTLTTVKTFVLDEADEMFISRLQGPDL